MSLAFLQRARLLSRHRHLRLWAPTQKGFRHGRATLTNDTINFGDVPVRVRERETDSGLVPDLNSEDIPSELLPHLRWMAQKYNLGQDMYLTGHPGNVRRNLVNVFAKLCNLETEYVVLSRDTTESDLKQRREISGNSVVFADQGPVRAAVQGRLLVLDGIEYAERNVLPTLNNLLENREMSLEDGRFLTKQSTIDKLPSEAASNSMLVPVHPDFRVIALGQSVPPYTGRPMDPPLRSRFQSRFVDELSVEGLAERHEEIVHAVSSRDPSKLQLLVNFYTSLRVISGGKLERGAQGGMSGFPVFTSTAFERSLNVLDKFPSMPASMAVQRYCPAGFWMRYALPGELKEPLKAVFDDLHGGASGISDSKSHFDSVQVTSQSSENITESKSETPKLSMRFESSLHGAVQLSDIQSGKYSVSSSLNTEDVMEVTHESSSQSYSFLPSQRRVLVDMLVSHANGSHICLLGAKGSGKSHIARAFGSMLGYTVHGFPLYQEMAPRDVLQKRITAPLEDGSGTQSVWMDTPLVSAARSGQMCILDGVDRVDTQTLFTLRALLNDGVLDLPSGERLRAHENFRIVATGLVPSLKRLEDARLRWFSSDLGFAYHNLPAAGIDEMRGLGSVVAADTQGGGTNATNALSKYHEDLFVAAAALEKAARNPEFNELGLSLRQMLRMLHEGSAIQGTDISPKVYIVDALKRTLLMKFTPQNVADKFNETISSLGWDKDPAFAASSQSVLNDVKTHLSEGPDSVQIGDLTIPKRNGCNPEKVPHPLFHANARQHQLLEEIARSYVSDEKAVLLIGNQGVGKNKLIDRFLELLHAEREYIQLHRDTTIQSLTVLPKFDFGKLTYEDSPLVRAARNGSVMVVDEADKAPLEVVCLLKALAEDGELILHDRRRLLSHERLLAEGGRVDKPPEDVVLIDPNFMLFVLANRPGFPFLGNNFFRECGDVFSIHIVDNLDIQSEIQLLQAYGPGVDYGVISRIARAFGSLREAHEKGDINYPFSAREAVAVVRHVAAYPDDGVVAAIEDILSFDNLNPTLRAYIAQTFNAHGLPVSIEAATSAPKLPPISLRTAHSIPQHASASAEFTITKNVASFDLSRKPMKTREWTSCTTTSSQYAIQSSRLAKFTEEIGRLSLVSPGDTVADPSGEVVTGDYLDRVVDMVVDDATSTVHVLTTQPLTLHSFTNIAAAIDDLRGASETPKSGASEPTDDAVSNPKSYIRRELLSEDMEWRLGTLTPSLGRLPPPSSLSSSSSSKPSCAVLLPELSVILAVPLDSSAMTTMHTVPFEDIAKSSGGMFGSNLFARGGSGSSTNGGKYVTCRGADAEGKYDLVAYQPEGGNLIFVNLGSKQTQHVNLHGVFPEGVQSVHALGANSWMVAGMASNGACVLRCSGKDNTVHLDRIDVSPHSSDGREGALSAEAIASILRASPGSSASAGTAGSSEHVLCLPGNASYMCANARMSDDSFNVQAIRRETDADVLSGACTLERTVNVSLQRDSEADHSEQLTLEFVDTYRSTVKSINISRQNVYMTPSESVTNVGTVLAVPTSEPGGDGKQTGNTTVALCHADGIIRFFECEDVSLDSSLSTWKRMYNTQAQNYAITKSNASGAVAGEEGTGKPRTGLSSPKHGKEDPKNDPHVGGNTWAGGTGGSDTAGLGGRGGPYRLDKGHKVHQVTDEMKAMVAKEGKERAAQIAKEALAKRLEEIQMGHSDYSEYLQHKAKVEGSISQLQDILDEFSRRSTERIWLKHQTHGDLDDSKLVDGLAGDRLVFKRRGYPEGADRAAMDFSDDDPHKKRMQFVVDVSGSMYRFNGQDRRLERSLEATLMIMEAMSASLGTAFNPDIDYAITGHSGDSPNIPFVSFNADKPPNEAHRLAVLHSMVAHTQFTMSGDNTVSAMKKAIDNVIKSADDERTDRYVFVVSDANFERYGISPRHLAKVMTKDDRVKVHLILIASLYDEANRIAKALPSGRVHLCYESTSLPAIFKSILASYGGAFDV